jgi:hypothetical protein
VSTIDNWSNTCSILFAGRCLPFLALVAVCTLATIIDAPLPTPPCPSPLPAWCDVMRRSGAACSPCEAPGAVRVGPAAGFLCSAESRRALIVVKLIPYCSKSKANRLHPRLSLPCWLKYGFLLVPTVVWFKIAVFGDAALYSSCYLHHQGRRKSFCAQNMEATRYSVTFVPIYKITWRRMPGDSNGIQSSPALEPQILRVLYLIHNLQWSWSKGSWLRTK